MITLTSAQAVALARVAGEHPPSLQLHQIGEDPDLFVTKPGQTQPELRICADGQIESLRLARPGTR